MEVKRHDGHGQDLVGDRSATTVTQAYLAAGAPCLSVVTGRWFGGSLDLLAEVARLTDVPILQKDFITRQGQLAEAKRLGASAVLLTAALLTRSTLARLADTALALGLTPFIEVTSEAELAGLPNAVDCVIAVNNKDIRQRERDDGDPERSRRMLPAVRATGTRCPVSASGIGDAATAAALLAQGYAGLLIGTSLLRNNDLPGWLSALDDKLAALSP
jgi:indole-3-glycerol phosphate synthase